MSLILGVAFLCITAFVANANAVEGYEILFRDTKSNLSKQEKRFILKELGFRLSKNRKYIADDTCGEDVSPSVEVVDLNGDGIEEVVVSWGNTCTSGMTGQSITLFIKDRKGRFVKNLDFPGSYEKLSSRSKGFPDLLISGPGFCHGVWQWTGTKYNYKCSREEEPGGCARKDVKTVCK
ncbi:MAG: hypothetical protein HZC44_00430 [Geobacter sp.]|nr:hypothetical protein [Geobacter sp.]